MSGHSKWAKIKRQKGANDAKRGAAFTRFGNAITVAAKEGGGDPDGNFKLRLAIDRAKAANVPNDNIERAIKRGTGELEGGVIEEVTYEGYGPGGVPYLIEILTDNRNRASADVRHTLTKHGGSLAGPGSVAWMFDKRGVVAADLAELTEELELALIDAGADEVDHADGRLAVLCAPADLAAVKAAVEAAGIEPDFADVQMVAKEKASPDPEARAKLERLESALDDLEDVRDYFTNVDA